MWGPSIYSIAFLIWPIIIIVIIIGLIFYFAGRRGGKTQPAENKDWYLQLALSREDAVSQWFFLLSVFFLGVTLLSFNRDLGDPLSWRTIVLLTSIVGLVVAYYFKVISVLIFSLIGVAGWWMSEAMEWTDVYNIKTASVLTGIIFIALLFYVLGHFHEQELKFKRFAYVYLILGIIAITGALFIFSSKPGLGMLAEMTVGAAIFGSWEITASLSLFFAVLVGLTLYLASKNFILVFEAAAVFILVVIFGILVFLPQQTVFMEYQSTSMSDHGLSDIAVDKSQLSANGVIWALVFNVTAFFELLGLIFSGYLRREEWLINLGTFFLFILIIVKYFDWFFTFLDKSLFFIGAGILLFTVGWFMEKSRRYMIANIKTEQQKS